METVTRNPKGGRKRLAKCMKKSNSLRSWEHRERKKFYIAHLEDKVRQLSEKVSNLELELLDRKNQNCSICQNVAKSTNSVEEEEKLPFSILSSSACNNVSVGQPDDSIDALLKKIEQEEDYWNYKLPSIIKRNPDEVRLSMIENIREKIGVYGSLRVKLLK